MKQFLILVLIFTGSLVACSETDLPLYKGTDYVRFYNLESNISVEKITKPTEPSYISSLNASNPSLVVKYKVQLIGNTSKKDRKVKFEQFFPEGEENQAVSGVNFVPFDDPEMAEQMIIPADSIWAYIPVKLTYDPAKGYSTYKLNFRIVDSEDLLVGTPKLLSWGFVQFSQYCWNI